MVTKQTGAPVGCHMKTIQNGDWLGTCSARLIANDFCSALKSLPSSELEVREAR